MNDAQTTAHSGFSKRNRAVVAKRLDSILAEIEELRSAVQCIFSERQRDYPEQEARR
jgi:hypothetical protein